MHLRFTREEEPIATIRDVVDQRPLRGCAMTASLLDLVQEIGKLEDRVRALGDTDRAGTKLELVHLRRELAALIGTIGTTADAHPVLTADPQLLREFRRRLSSVRTAVALHQADWPAVSSARDDPQYRASAARVTRENLSFAGWVKQVLGNV
ncbi:hypothetical protein [Sphingomonas koreensis]